MDIQEKIEILTEGAKYDVSCSSSGSSRRGSSNGIGSTASSGICHSWADDGRCISLLKILYSNYCIYDCIYCVNRASNDVRRAAFTPEELAKLTIEFYKRNYIEGLFLSSGVINTPDYTMECLIQTMKILREQYRFNGYIHMKAIPGADEKLIQLAGTYADRMSINIELPTEESLLKLAPQKKKEMITKPMTYISNQISEQRENRKKYKRTPSFVPAGQSTQLIIGATPDKDYQVLRLTEGLYKHFQLKRVYYSSYIPIVEHPSLPTTSGSSLVREHRLYQADWLLRFYGFDVDELFNNNYGQQLDLTLDPKCDWALRNIELFPVEVNKADYEMLLKVPGIGIKSARKIVTARRFGPISYEGLKQMGIVLKRAQYFITCQGKYYGSVSLDGHRIRNKLVGVYGNQQSSNITIGQSYQLSFF
ncbi:putative DNA modification/repair radical SAM protein [Desulfuribacillus alkaliarsenatis]|uniref:Putative DNA modification/repair radical SAM protein n=1 Tax=Desulfuribacillus alkaliarsenatis TaxID=766136 RepID=A0A1E5G0Q6_9FIRM|nr:putative DNA modification/repair radical SAM protein [Desulfuribacillus alkaliarsenatis]OEF96299.1 putative DNA modification/repair radical SAM protein [Desulfuribacillus alkaliarsenatis]